MTQSPRPSEAVETIVEPDEFRAFAADRSLSKRPADSAEFEARLARLERAMEEQRAISDARVAELTASLAALAKGSGDNEPTGDVAELRVALAARDRQLAEFEAAAREKVFTLSEALATLEQHPVWRATAPLRAAGAALPRPVRSALRQLARAAYWVVTPQRMPARLQWLIYSPRMAQTLRRMEWLNTEALDRLGPPLRRAYGPTAIEQLDLYRTAAPNAPVFVSIHPGTWRLGEARDCAYAAEMFVGAGAHYVAPDFAGIREAGGDVRVMADQVRRAIAWVYQHAAEFGGDRDRIYVGGHSSGAHLSAIAMVTDWAADYGLPPDVLKGGLLMSGVYDLSQIRASRATAYVRLSEEIAHAMSPHNHIDRLNAPVIVTYSSSEAQEYRQQARGLHAALTAAGKPARLIAAAHYGHMEMAETLASPYGTNGRAALDLMGLSPPPPIAR